MSWAFLWIGLYIFMRTCKEPNCIKTAEFFTSLPRYSLIFYLGGFWIAVCGTGASSLRRSLLSNQIWGENVLQKHAYVSMASYCLATSLTKNAYSVRVVVISPTVPWETSVVVICTLYFSYMTRNTWACYDIVEENKSGKDSFQVQTSVVTLATGREH